MTNVWRTVLFLSFRNGGNGMIAYEFKGGTGTASRRVEIGGETYTVAALVQANYGRRPWFTVLGVPVGKEMPVDQPRTKETGSIMVIFGIGHWSWV